VTYLQDMTGQLKAPVREVPAARFEGNLAAGGSGENRRVEGRSNRTRVIERIIGLERFCERRMVQFLKHMKIRD